jgi:hypothetical protein
MLNFCCGAGAVLRYGYSSTNMMRQSRIKNLTRNWSRKPLKNDDTAEL